MRYTSEPEAGANPTSNRRPAGSASRGGQASCSSSWESWSSATGQSLRSWKASPSPRWRAGTGSRARRSTAGCAGTRRAASPRWPTAPTAPRPARIAWLPRSRRGSWRCAPSIRAGDRGPCSTTSRARSSPRSPAAPRSTAASPPRPDRAAEAPEEARGLPPLGAPAGHGALADGRHGRRAARGRRRAQGRHRDRRPLALLRLRAAHAAGHGAAGLRGLPRRHAPPRRPRAGAHRQRQGLHGALRTRHGPGALRPHLPRERHPSPADRAAQPDDHRQGRALPQDGALPSSSPAGSSPPSRRPRRRSTSGSRTTTRERPHQGIGMVAPLRRFELAAAGARAGRAARGRIRGRAARAAPAHAPRLRERDDQLRGRPLPRRRLARRRGGRAHPARRPPGDRPPRRARRLPRAPPRPQSPGACARPPRPAPGRAPCAPLASGPAVKRKVDPTGYVSFAGRGYFVSNRLRGEQVEVRLAGDTVQISQSGVLLKTHVARHDRAKEHGAFSTPQGRPAPHQCLPLLKGRGWNTTTGANP